MQKLQQFLCFPVKRKYTQRTGRQNFTIKNIIEDHTLYLLFDCITQTTCIHNSVSSTRRQTMKHIFTHLMPVMMLLTATSAANTVNEISDRKDRFNVYFFQEMHVVLKYRSSVFNKKYVEKILTPRKALNRTTSITSTDIQFKPNVVLDAPLYLIFYFIQTILTERKSSLMSLQIQLAMFRKFATQYKPFMVDYTFEVCEALILKTHPLYMVFHHKTNESESNFLNPCPKKVRPYVNFVLP